MNPVYSEHCVAVLHRFFDFFFKDFVLVLLSRPSAGKGKLIKFLEAFGFKVVGCSDALDDLVKSHPEDPEIQKIPERKAKGLLAEDHHVKKAILKKMSSFKDPKRLSALEGFPRNPNQADILEGVLAEETLPCLVIELVCSREEANERRLQRIGEAVEAGKEPRAEDVDEEVWNNRQDEFEGFHDEIEKRVSRYACYRKIETTTRPMVINHADIFKIIFFFALLNSLGLSKKLKERLLSLLLD